MFELDDVESWLVVLLALFGFFWQLVLVPFLPSFGLWTLLNPFWQYIIYNLGFVAFFISIVGVGFGFVINKRLDLVFALRSGIAMFLLFSLLFDLWQPPFAYSSCGNLLITDAATLSGAAVDRMLGYLFDWVSFKFVFGSFCLSLKYIMIYFLVPILSLVAAALLLDAKDFVGMVFEHFGQK